MQRAVLTFASIGLAAIGWAIPAMAAKPAGSPQAEAQALDLARQTIAMRSVKGAGNRTGDVARAFKAALIAGGWSDGDIAIVPLDDTAYLIATWHGSDPALKPLVISGHMDVVEAKPADWKRDPFVPVVENGTLFGRGASDMKYSASLAVATLIDLRRQGFKPRRDVVVAFSGDEETAMHTSQAIAERLANAELVLNIDGGIGVLAETDGKPQTWSWEGAEKTYADFRLEVTNPGGHSSMPRADNAIVQLARALEKVGTYRFTPEASDLTRAYFTKAAPFQADPRIAAAMRAFAADPTGSSAIAMLRAEPGMVGKIGTTCVPTLVSGGHAENALPQRATANINCRIFPGHAPAAIMAELGQAIGDPAVTITDVSEGSVASPASPMRPDLLAALDRAMGRAWPGVPIIPAQASGASDSMWYRAKGVPAYGVSPLFLKESEDFSHGLDERIPLANTRPAIVFYRSLVTDLAK